MAEGTKSTAPHGLTAETIAELATRAADVAATAAMPVAGVTMGEMADGSRRVFALLEMREGDHEREFRVTSPAPFDAPAWAASFDEWRVEARIAEGWMWLGWEVVAEMDAATVARLELEA
jgi:hypothetical protein